VAVPQVCTQDVQPHSDTARTPYEHCIVVEVCVCVCIAVPQAMAAVETESAKFGIPVEEKLVLRKKELVFNAYKLSLTFNLLCCLLNKTITKTDKRKGCVAAINEVKAKSLNPNDMMDARLAARVVLAKNLK
jgi:hypothetical protein